MFISIYIYFILFRNNCCGVFLFQTYPTQTKTQLKKGDTHPHPAKKKSHPFTHNWKKECDACNTWYIREKYSFLTKLVDVFILRKGRLVNLFSLNTFKTAFESIVCLFLTIANYILENSKVKVKNVWNTFVFFHYVVLLLYKIIKKIYIYNLYRKNYI